MRCFLKGGYPEPRLTSDERLYQLWMQNYLQTYIERDIRTLYPRLDLIKYRRFTSMLTPLSGTIINRSQVGRSLDTSDVSVRDYLEIADGSFIWRNIPSFEKSKSKSIVKMPKGNFRDSGLAHYMQGVRSLDELDNSPSVGTGFEAFIIEEIIKGVQATQAINWNYSYYRTRNGAEIDLILQGDFGMVPIEIKYGTATRLKHLQTLKKFVLDFDLPLGIVINNSDYPELLTERIIQIPSIYI
jgi:predicted AAA+ superfamily ATPase